MTRINLVDPSELTDQHLFAEFREITRIPAHVIKSSAKLPIKNLLHHVPDQYRLGYGHVTFFYNKGLFLYKRFDALVAELEVRAVINFNRAVRFDTTGIMRHPLLYNDYTPSNYEIGLSKARLAERIALKPSWYRYKGKPYEFV